jgi:hypothetical protein
MDWKGAYRGLMRLLIDYKLKDVMVYSEDYIYCLKDRLYLF